MDGITVVVSIRGGFVIDVGFVFPIMCFVQLLVTKREWKQCQ